MAVLCNDGADDELAGEGYAIAGLTRLESAKKMSGLASDGAPAMFGDDNGALTQLIEACAPHAIKTWCFTHRSGLVGRDMEKNPTVQVVRRFVVKIASDMNKSALRNQQRLEVLRDALNERIAVLNAHDVRWLSTLGAARNIGKQYGPLTLYYSRRTDADAKGLFKRLSRTDYILQLHGVIGVLDPLQALSKALQRSDSGLPDVLPLADRARRTLRQLFLENPAGTNPANPGSSCGPAFAALVSNERRGMNASFTVQMLPASHEQVAPQIRFEGVAASDAVACMVVPGTHEEVLVLWHDAGAQRTSMKPTTEAAWADCVQKARAELADAAQFAIELLDQRFTDDTGTVLQCSKFMTPEYWNLLAGQSLQEREQMVDGVDLDQLQGQLVELAQLFNASKEVTAGDGTVHVVPPKVSSEVFVRDLDGTAGGGERVLNSALADECAELVNFVKEWPEGSDVRSEKRQGGMLPWRQFWEGLLDEESSNFVELCPHIANLIMLLLVMVHGSVGNERKIADLNLIKDDKRSGLGQVHLNAAARVRDQKDKLLRPYSETWGKIVAAVL